MLRVTETVFNRLLSAHSLISNLLVHAATRYWSSSATPFQFAMSLGVWVVDSFSGEVLNIDEATPSFVIAYVAAREIVSSSSHFLIGIAAVHPGPPFSFKRFVPL
jgi:hypothetical protein